MRLATIEEYQETGDRVKGILGCSEIPVSQFTAELFEQVLEAIQMRNDTKKDA
jgi:hypothetical protein